MLKTPNEILLELGRAIRERRVAQQWTQQEAAERAGMALRTWRRLELGGQATILQLVNAAVTLRCEEKIQDLFPAPEARTMDELLERQSQPASQQRARRRRP